DLVVEITKLREKLGEPRPVRVAAAHARPRRRRVLVVVVRRDARDDPVGIVGVERLEIPCHHRAGARRLRPAGVGHRSLPQTSRIVAYTFWFQENSMTFPSGSLAAQM